MTRTSELRKELLADMKKLTESGYKCYMVKDESWCYGYIITPNDNVLYIQTSLGGGYDVSLQYKPSRESGTGCRCNASPVLLTVESLEECERSGLNFAHKLHAILYKNSAEYKPYGGYIAVI